MLSWEGPQISNTATLPISGNRADMPSCRLVSEPSGKYQAPAETPAPLGEDEKRIINAKGDNKPLYPLRYQWAWQRYQLASADDWSPMEVDLSLDRLQWQQQHLSDDEQRIVQYSLGFFSSADLLVANHPVLALYRHITNPECRHFLLRQAFEEGRHAHACLHLADTLGLDSGQLHREYHRVDSVANKAAWAKPFMRCLGDSEFQTGSTGNDREFLRELVIFYLVFQGLFQHVGFVQIRSLGRRNKLPGTAELLRRMQHSIDQHIGFGVDVVNQIKLENPHLWDRELQIDLEQTLREAVSLETQYAYETMPRGVLGLNAPMFEEYLQFVANERSAQVGLSPLFPGATNAFPWMRNTQPSADRKQAVHHTKDSQALNWD